MSNNDLVFALFTSFIGLIAFCVLIVNIRITLIQRACAKHNYTPPSVPSKTE